MKRIFRLFIFILILIFQLQPAYASEGAVNNLNIDVIIDQSGDATVTETIELMATQGSEFYQVMNRMNQKELTMVSVTRDQTVQYAKLDNWDPDALSREQKYNHFGINDKGDSNYELCFGIEHQEHTYTMVYHVTNFVNKYQDATGINYNFFELNIPLKKASIQISAPQSFQKDNTEIYAFGYEGKVNFEAGRIKMISTGKIKRMQLFSKTSIPFAHYDTTYENKTYKSLLKDAKKGSDYDDDGVGVLGVFMALFVGFLVVAGVLLFALADQDDSRIKRYIKLSKKDKENIPNFHDIPTHHLLYASFLVDQTGLNKKYHNPKLIAAYMLKMIRDRNVHFVGEKKDYVVEFLEMPQDENAKELYEIMQKAANKENKATRKALESQMKKHYKKLYNWFDELYMNQKKYLHDQGHLHKNKIDDQTVEDIHHTYGLYKFLKDADNMDEKKVLDVMLWDDYLVYATLFDIADEVKKQLGEVHPDYYEQSDYRPDYDTIYWSMLWANSIMRASNTGYSLSEQQVRSSGGGGWSSMSGGGGFSSGGGGGGIR